MNSKINSHLILKVERPVFGGLSIARHEGKIVMIRGTLLPGETVEINIENEKKDYLMAAVTKILDPSSQRIEPACRYFGSCGGCHLQHVPHNLQITVKEEILQDCLRRLGNIELDLSESIVNENPWHYRLRGQFKASHEGIGFYRENSREVVDICGCPLMAEEINEYFHKARMLLKGFHVEEVYIVSGNRCMALIKTPTRARSKKDWDTLALAFLDAGFSALFIEVADKKILRYGESYVTLNLENLKYTISPMSFFQSNWKLNQKVVKLVKNNLVPLKGKKILDLYAGAGNFSLPLAHDAQIFAVEENLYTMEDGKRNVELNNIKNFSFIRSSAEKFRIEGCIDIVILDPPRAGLTNKAIKNVLSIMPERIVYISCNPTTFARDLKKLHSKYAIESMRMIDYFPQTFHIESVAFLRRSKKKGIYF